jgi:TfoX/Sxy family transcriptional regulator of competence genes
MFGEYALYVEGKVVAFVCDDKLFMKPNPADAGFKDKCVAGPAYPGSKDYWEVPADLWDEREWLVGIFQASADALPAPKPKKPRK